MSYVCTVIQRRQVPHQTQPSDWPPTHILDPPVVGLGIGRDLHRPPCVLAVVECQEETSSRVELALSIGSHWERTALQSRQAEEDCSQIAGMPEMEETPLPQNGHVRGKPDAQNIDVIEFAALVREPQDVAG